MTLTKVFCASLLALVLLVSAGCGQKGPLALPNASAYANDAPGTWYGDTQPARPKKDAAPAAPIDPCAYYGDDDGDGDELDAAGSGGAHTGEWRRGVSGFSPRGCGSS